tara:strand:+ start:1593 stop:3137 length:1545 start_codon:yes stop_codon:yes gene_type:complete
MAISRLLTGSARTREVILPAQSVGSIITGSHGQFVGLPVAGKTIDLNGSAQAIPVDVKNHLQAAFANNSSSLIDAINFNQTSLQSLESGQDLDFQGGSGGAQSVALSSEAMSFAAGTGLASVGSSNTITYNLNTPLTSLAGLSNAAAAALADLSDAEVGILDGAEVSTAELNIIDGDTSATSTTLADADRVVVNDAGTMKQVALTDFEVYFESSLDTLSSVTTVGALNAGSITSGFGSIDNGASAISTTGLGSFGSLDVDNVVVNGSTIGHTDDSDLLTLADGIVTVAGEISVTTLDIGGTNVTSTAEELNLLDGVSGLVQADFTKLASVDSTAAELNLVDGGSSIGTTAVSDGHGLLMNHGGTMAQTTVQTLAAYLDDEITAMPNLVSVGTIATGVWNGTAITEAYIGTDAIVAAKIKDDAVGASEIVALGVGSAELQAGAVLGAKLAANVVKASGYVVLNADPDTAGGLVLRGEDTDGSAQDYVLQVDGGMLSLRMISTVSESGAQAGESGS